MDFTQVEKEFIRQKVLPEFDWTKDDLRERQLRKEAH